MPRVPDLFLEQSVRYLRDTYVPRLERALETLRPGEVWLRPHAEVLSVGVILTHLEGNVRQWVLSGLGDEPDARDRATEFARTRHAEGSELMARLRETVDEACRVITGLDKADLKRVYALQGFELSGLEALYHVVEHFSWHTGQVVWIAKACAGRQHGLSFYDNARINAARND